MRILSGIAGLRHPLGLEARRMLRRYHATLDEHKLDLCRLRLLPHRWRLGRRDVGVLAVFVAAPADLLAARRRAQFHVVLAGPRLGHPRSRRCVRPVLERRVVPLRRHVPHQPQEQSGRPLGSPTGLCRLDHHNPDDDVRLLH